MRASARSLGIVINRTTKRVVRIINPDFECELDLHRIAGDEFLLRVAKARFGVKANAITGEQIDRIIDAYSSK